MPATGSLVFFSTHPIDRLGSRVTRLLERFGVSQVSSINNAGSQPNWEQFQIDRIEAEARRDAAIRSGTFEVVISALDDDMTCHGERLTLPEAATIIDRHKDLHIAVYSSEMAQRISDSIRDDVSPNIRGDYSPSDISVLTAEQDVFSQYGGPRGTFYGHAFFSVTVFGYGLPKDPIECRRAVLALPIVAEIRAIIEDTIGPVETCIFWD